MTTYKYRALIVGGIGSFENAWEKEIEFQASHIREAAIIAMEEAEELEERGGIGAWVVSIEQAE